MVNIINKKEELRLQLINDKIKKLGEENIKKKTDISLQIKSFNKRVYGNTEIMSIISKNNKIASSSNKFKQNNMIYKKEKILADQTHLPVKLSNYKILPFG